MFWTDYDASPCPQRVCDTEGPWLQVPIQVVVGDPSFRRTIFVDALAFTAVVAIVTFSPLVVAPTVRGRQLSVAFPVIPGWC